MDQTGFPLIEQAIVDAVLAGRIRLGARLGEQALADLFEVSRTTVREALIRLEARGIVQVVPRRGWFIVEPSTEESGEAFRARCVVELGILGNALAITADLVETLRQHIGAERDAIARRDVSAHCFLSGHFHVQLANALGNRLLADILLDLTARTVPIAALYMPVAGATRACDEHEGIVEAIAAGDLAQASRLMAAHLAHIEAVMPVDVARDQLTDLRAALRLPPKPH